MARSSIVAEIERVPAEEAKQIENIIRLTVEQVRKRCPGEKPNFRGVHVKDHGCVRAHFKVLENLPEDLRIGVFANPGQEYQAWIRYSNASVSLAPDSPPSAAGGLTHGSRGMAVKLMGVRGESLMPANGPVTQDFLMVNHPVFPFANVEDYEALSEILLKDNDNPARFFSDRIHKKPDGTPDVTDPVTRRALRSLGIVKRIQSLSLTATPPAYQVPPASPLDNQYFGAAPFLFGDDRVMKFSAKPVSPNKTSPLTFTDASYLRTALHESLTAKDARDVVFEFQVQVRKASDLAGKIDDEIEDVSFEWEEAKYPFVTVGTITIPPQDFETAERRALCENLNFTPWHGIAEHRPLGGINRLRRAVYEASAGFRHVPKEPAHFLR
jgi:hypothetical protein